MRATEKGFCNQPFQPPSCLLLYFYVSQTVSVSCLICRSSGADRGGACGWQACRQGSRPVRSDDRSSMDKRDVVQDGVCDVRDRLRDVSDVQPGKPLMLLPVQESGSFPFLPCFPEPFLSWQPCVQPSFSLSAPCILHWLSVFRISVWKKVL